MSEHGNARLKSTGEPVVILNPGSGDRYRHCLLPPQAPWHRSRVQWIGKEKLSSI